MTDKTQRYDHDLMNFVGIRAPLTAAAVLQLMRELQRAGVLNEDAIDRIKGAVVNEADLTRRPHLSKAEFASNLRTQLDRLFADGRGSPEVPEEVEQRTS